MADPAELRRLADALDESATEVQSFPHPSHCDHLHVAHKVMRDAAAILRSLAEVQPPEQDAKDALRWQELRRRHEGKTDPLQRDAEGFPMPQEPTACDFTVFMPDPSGIESLVPVGCLPGELDETIDAAIAKEPI